METSIGFRRNIYRHWLDAAAAFCAETADTREIRVRLEPIVEQTVKREDNRRQAIDILINIWVKTGEAHPALRHEAVVLFAQSEAAGDRLWLHYGLTLLRYDFFRLGAMIIGQLSAYSDELTPADVKKRVFAEIGQLGAADKATERVIFSLRNWGILVDGERRAAYRPLRHTLGASSRTIEEWLLAAALTAHPAEELPFNDLIRLPELFPFRFTLGVDDLRGSRLFEVHRQGLGWDMVRLAPRAVSERVEPKAIVDKTLSMPAE